MRNRGNTYLSLLLITAGLYLLLANLAGPWLHLWWDQLWPGVLLLAAVAFYLPIAVWWDRRPSLAGLAVPGTIFLVNAAILFYNALTGDWDAWAYLWTLEPLAVAAGLYLTWLLGARSRGLLVGALVIGPHATDVIGQITLAMRHGLTVENIAETIHPHPTFAEAVAEAAEAWVGLPRHTLR